MNNSSYIIGNFQFSFFNSKGKKFEKIFKLQKIQKQKKIMRKAIMKVKPRKPVKYLK